MSSTTGYTAAFPAHTMNSGAQKYGFDSPSTIAKQQQFNSQGQLQQDLPVSSFPQQSSGNIPPPPPMPSWNNKLGGNNLKLRTRNWDNQPFGQQNLSSRGSSGIPISNYQPTSTIPLNKNYQLPSSPLAQSNLDAPFSQGQSNWNQSNIPTPPPLPTWNNKSSSLNKGFGGMSLNKQSNIPAPPPVPTWNNRRQGSNWNRNLRTRNWGNRGENGWSNFNGNQFKNESALPFNQQNRGLNWNQQQLPSQGIQQPIQQSNWNQGLQQPSLGQSSLQQPILGSSSLQQPILGQSSLQQPILGQQSNWNQSLPQSSFGQSSLQQPILGQSSFQQPILGQSSLQQPILGQSSWNQGLQQQPIIGQPILSQTTTSQLPIANALLPITQPALTGRKGRRQNKKLLKQAAIQQKLTSNFNPPAGDPAVNSYRRGAKAVVPLMGPAVQNNNSRRRGRSNNRGSRRNRVAGARVLPVPATQPPFVAPVAAAPILGQQSFIGQPILGQQSSFVGQPILGQQSSFIGQQSFGQQPILGSSFAQQSNPLLSAQNTINNQFLQKQYSQPQVYTRPTGSATF